MGKAIYRTVSDLQRLRAIENERTYLRLAKDSLVENNEPNLFIVMDSHNKLKVRGETACQV